ncbi:MAG: translocation/assembly module TamB domain-containing protein [Rhodobacteraceae bacterium]|nr:translocation/assembly module TamB domain-containing protein [Paracoccaceae bacterium]
MLRRTTFALCLVPLPALADEGDRGYLTAFLEDNLSSAGRQVTITGFEGALSSQARMTELTLADDIGVWLTLRDVVLDWNRGALLSGKIAINELSAAEIIMARPPRSADTGIPAPEAGSFALPDIPVSIAINRISADKIVLDAAVLGQPVEGTFQAAMTLAGGEGSADLVLERTDEGPSGRIALTASYSNTLQSLSLDLVAEEAANGLISQALKLPGQPAVALNISGKGPFRDFSADVTLATDGQSRLAGRVMTQSSGKDTGFSANLSGNIAPLFLPDYAEFFGDRVSLAATGKAFFDGRVDLSQLQIDSRALSLKGTLGLGADSSPSQFNLTARIAHDDAAPVLLPWATTSPLWVQSADLTLGYDRSKGEGWTAQAKITGIDRQAFRASSLILAGSGRIKKGQFGATLRFDAEGLEFTDAALGEAIGSILSGDAVLTYAAKDGGLAISRLTLSGEDYGAKVFGGRIEGLAKGFTLSGNLAADLSDLSRFSQLAKRPIAGAAGVSASGSYGPLTGAFDISSAVTGQDIALGIPVVDALLAGTATASADLTRDQTGTHIRAAHLSAKGLKAELQGLLASAASDLSAKVQLEDMSVIAGFGGAITAEAQLTGPLNNSRILANAVGQGLRVGNPQLDKLLGGKSQLSAELGLQDGAVRIDSASFSNAELTGTVRGLVSGGQQVLDVMAQVRNLAVLLPEFPGPLSISGQVVNDATGARVDLLGKGPGGIDAAVTGRIAAGRGDLAIKGRAQAGLANAFITPRAITGGVDFDLRLNGPLQASSLVGRVSLENGRYSDPALGFGFDGISARADLGAGQARIAATLPLTTDGRITVSGTIGLIEPYIAALDLDLQAIGLRDPDLYDARLQGALRLVGPLSQNPILSGKVELLETELRVPSTGFGGAAGLPDLRHTNEPAAVRATRGRAGLLDKPAQSGRQGGSDLALDIIVSAPNRIFLRGRALDAELGGEIQLRGSLSNLQPSGAFNLVRGRLEILGKRFDLDEALLQLEGNLVPFLRVRASTENGGIVSNILIEGRADDPKVSFTSVPELPEEEVISQLLFGQGLQNLSALQALQLASAVATLAGRGGEGVMAKLRKGVGLDNLDVKTTTEGGTEVTAGKYIGKNVYSEVTVGQNGKSQINLNLDLTDSITLRGSTSTDGNTGFGVFLEKDY